MGLFDLPVIGDALSYIGGRQANDANKDIAFDTNQMSQANAREQMAFQERMSNTTHAREVADLKNAGLNPILSANGGASSPSGASGSVVSATMENTMKGLGQSAREQAQLNLNKRKQDAELGNMEATKALAEAQKRNVDMDTIVKSKGAPQADMINRAYKLANPVLEKFESWMQNGAKKPTNQGKKPSEYDMNIPNPWKSNAK